MSGLSAGDSRHLGNLAKSMETIAKVLTTANENFVRFARDAANQNERIIEELAKANVPFGESSEGFFENRMRQYKAVADDITRAAESLEKTKSEIPTEPKWNVGDRVRVISETSPFYGWVGEIERVMAAAVDVRFSGGEVGEFGTYHLHHMGAHLKPVDLGPEWYVGATVRVIDKFTLMHDKIGKIVGLTNTDVDVVDLSSTTGSGGTFHPSQLEIVPIEGMSAIVTIEGDFYFGQEGTVVAANPGWVEVMMHNSVHQNYGHGEIEIDWDKPREHVCGKGCAGHTTGEVHVFQTDGDVLVDKGTVRDWVGSPKMITDFTEEDLQRNVVARMASEMDRFPVTPFTMMRDGVPARHKYMELDKGLATNRPIPDPAQYDDFIKWVLEEAHRQGIDPKKITFVQGEQEGQALMRVKESWTMSPQEEPRFEVKLPRGLEVPSPSYMEEHFGHLEPPIKRKHQGFAHMDGCVNEDCEGNCPAIVKSKFLRTGVLAGSLSIKQALDIEEAEKKTYDDEGHIVSEAGVNIPIVAPDPSDVAFTQMADQHDDTRD